MFSSKAASKAHILTICGADYYMQFSLCQKNLNSYHSYHCLIAITFFIIRQALKL